MVVQSHMKLYNHVVRSSIFYFYEIGGPNNMATGKRQTYYFKTLDAMKEIAKEEQIEVNGSMLEALFWERYVGLDNTYKGYMKELYTGEKTLRQVIINILDVMAYSEEHMNKNNLEFVKIVRDILGSSVWYNPSDNYTDYTLDNRETRVNNIANILGTIVRELENRSNIVEKTPIFQDMNPWELTVQDERYSEILKNKDNYTQSKIKEFKIKEEELRFSLNDDNILPRKVLDLIIENWDYFWRFSSVYEAVEYCVILSKELCDKPLIRKKMRTFFLNNDNKTSFSYEIEIQNLAKHKDTMQRLLRYSELLNNHII